MYHYIYDLYQILRQHADENTYLAQTVAGKERDERENRKGCNRCSDFIFKHLHSQLLYALVVSKT